MCRSLVLYQFMFYNIRKVYFYGDNMFSVIISPAKKMRCDPDSLEYTALPEFTEKSEKLLKILKSMSYAELKTLWQCNDKIAGENFENLQITDLKTNLTPAILAYDGIRFKYMAPEVFSYKEFEYIQNHLFILSGFYGAVRPFDGVILYRLEMQAKLQGENFKNLYDFWRGDIAKYITDGRDTVINLASDEYFKAVKKYFPENIRVVTCVFADLENGKLKEKGVKCKMARGEIVRYMAENNVQSPEELKKFQRQGYAYRDDLSSDDRFVFVQKKICEKHRF